MRLPRFEYLEPETIEEACSLLSQKETKVIAGGTDLLGAMKQKVVTPRALVNIKTIPNLDYVDYEENEGLRIGALATLHTVATSSVVKDRFGILAQAAGSVGTLQVRNMATLGGNICLDSRCFYYNQSLPWRQSRPTCYKAGGDVCHVVKTGDHCHALLMADTVPALIASDAEVRVAGQDGEKQIALEKFFTGRGEKPNLLQPGQVLTQVRVPDLPSRAGGAYQKYSLSGTVEFAAVSVAVVIYLEPGDGVCHTARIVFGSVASKPVRAVDAERVARGRRMNDKLIDDIGQAAEKEIHPVTHMGIPASYKRRLIETLVRRAVRQAWQQAGSA